MPDPNVFMVGEGSPLMPPLPGSPAEAPPNMAARFGNGTANPIDGVPRFRMEAVRQADGNYVNVEFVDILTPGDPKTIPCHKVTPLLRQKYAPWYEHWRKGLTMAPVGVPLEMWPMLDPAQVQSLKAINIFTVEQLIAVPDAHLHNMPMGRTIRNQAEVWMKEKGKADVIENARRETESMKAGMSMLESQVAALSAALAAQSKTAPAPSPEPEKRRPQKSEAA